MGEEKKETNGGEGDGVEENKLKENESIVIKVDMHCHCEACAKKIFRSIRSYQGVEDVAVDRKTNMVVVKGKTAEPLKLCDRIRHKTGRNAQLLSPLPKPPTEEEKPKDDKNKDQKDEPPHKDQPHPVVTVVLGVQMHCEACAQLLRKRIRKIKGVESVETDVGKGQVIVKGVIGDPEVLVKYVHKKTRKQVSIVKDDVEQDKKQDEAAATTTTSSSEQENHKKEEEEEVNKDDNNNTNNTIIDDAKMMMMMMTGEMNSWNDYYWPSARIDYHNHHNNNLNYQPPQMFSDENPNACSIM